MFLSGKTAFAAEPNCQWIETEGEAAVENITPEEARQLSLNRAKIKAVEGVSTVKVNAVTLVENYSLIADFINTISTGYVLDEKVVEWSSKIFQEKKDSPPVTIYTVKLKSCVASDKGGDPYFRIKGELNRPFFIAGEDAKIKAACTKDCYISIINLTADRKIRVLLPNDYEPSPFIKKGESYNFPAEGLGLEMYPLSGHKKDVEAFLLIATKERFDALKLIKKGEDIQPKDFYNAILSIPADSRAEEILAYEVREKN
jgi:hypothetical protein